MSPLPDSPTDALAERLPFSLNDFERVNGLYATWMAKRERSLKHQVDLWTYCYVRHYFMLKFGRISFGRVSDQDELVASCMRVLDENLQGLAKPGSYASWVSVVCRNAYFSYLRRRRWFVAYDDSWVHTEDEEHVAAPLPVAIVYQVLAQAVSRLPRHQQECAFLRFVVGEDYQAIAEVTEMPLPTVRTYVNKALQELREDAGLRAYLDVRGG